MERIAIIGCGGSGKSRLARRLAARLDLPVTHLDAVYYDADWNALPQEEFAAIQRELITASARWIIEGNYASTLAVRLAAADTVILLDLPTWTCLRGVLQRRIRHCGGQQPATGIYNRVNVGFVRYIWGYRRLMLPRVHQLITEHAGGAEIVVLRSRRAVRDFLAGLPAPG
jgi:adenylate kinase family enzyme